MLSVSQKMEAEFREMVLQEKMLKKQAIEGSCYAAGRYWVLEIKSELRMLVDK